MPRAQHYLTNKEILKEIHNSKMTYCWVMDKKYHMFDTIVDSVEDINEETITLAKEARAKRLQKLAHEAEVKRWERGELKRSTKPRAIDFAVDLADIDENDLVIRVMTFEHVPLENRKKNPKTIADHHAKCNFPPFKQYALIEGTWTEVARSHWNGDLTDGKFSVTHGKTNERLAFMYIKLCERISTKGNWRGYTYIDEMRGQGILQLAQIGLQFNEAKSDNPFSYYTAAVNNAFTRVLNLEKRNQNIRDDLLEDGGFDPSFTRTFNAEWEGVKEREGIEDFYTAKPKGE